MKNYMQEAFDLAKIAYDEGEVPVGAVIVDSNGLIVGSGYNMCKRTNNPTMHAEFIAISEALFERRYLNDCDLYVTLEPCPMCHGAIELARIRRVYFGAYRDTKSRTALPDFEIYEGIMREQCSNLLIKFFNEVRNKDFDY
ncbi:MAG: nucleoside deaminase [Ruminococcus sp.]|jgi:tRNA(adenine34) deaminase|nr:nucleoside deaminase [Ruminococcus sp.]